MFLFYVDYHNRLCFLCPEIPKAFSYVQRRMASARVLPTDIKLGHETENTLTSITSEYDWAEY